MNPIRSALSLVLPGHGDAPVAVAAECYRTGSASGVWFESATVAGRSLSDGELAAAFPEGSPQRLAVVAATLAEPVPVPALALLTTADVDRMDAALARRPARTSGRRTRRAA